jgi:hypothetical protein
MYTKSALIVNWTDIEKIIDEPMSHFFITDKTIDNELSYLFRINDSYTLPYAT